MSSSKNRLVLVRHGHALSEHEAGVPSDAERPLSERGRGDAAFTGGKLLALGVAPSVILASPLVRAQQTAAILSERIGAPVVTVKELSGDYNLRTLWLAVRASMGAADCCVVVGHQPQMGLLGGVLLGAGEGFPFSPGGCVSLLCEGEWPEELACGVAGAEFLMLAPKE